MGRTGTERDPFEVKSLDPDQLVDEFTPLVNSIVFKLRKKLRMQVEIDDLMSYGFRGLLDAHERFDPNNASSFANYAYYRIRGSILDGCRKEGWLTRRRSKEEAEKLSALNQYLDNAYEIEANAPRPGSFSEALDRVDNLVSSAATILMVKEAELEETLIVDEPQTRGRELDDKRKMLKAGLDSLDETEYEVVRRFYFEGESMTDIGSDLGYSKSWVSRVNTRAVEKMRDVVLQPHFVGPEN